MAAQLPAHLRLVRGLLRRLNSRFTSTQQAASTDSFDEARFKQAEQALRELPMPSPAAQEYFEKHLERLAGTLALVPPPQATGRALELGCYMQITPFLSRLCGYREVRGAFYGAPGRVDEKTISFPDGDFTCFIDHFDAEKDPFPYPDEHFDLVVAGEIIEHMTADPMHLMLESRRVLRDGGFLLITTPNTASIASVAKVLDAHSNPQIFALYKRPDGVPEVGHVREYTVYELGETAKAAGFEVVRLFTTFMDEFAHHRPLLKFLEANGYHIENRGEQSWCLALKRAQLPVDRYPFFLYSP